MIYYSIPWNSEQNIGKAYNDFMSMLPHDDDYACFLDGDAMFLVSNFGKQLDDIVDKHKDIGLFTCKTNRVRQKKQVLDGNWEDNDIAYHRTVAQDLQNRSYTEVELWQGGGLMSGVLILIKKELWKKLGGFKDGFFSVDNDIHAKAMELGAPVAIMTGVYVYHWYRGGDKKNKHHLTAEAMSADTETYKILAERTRIYKERRAKRTVKKIIYSAITGPYVGKDTAPHYQIPEGWEYRLYSNNKDCKEATHFVDVPHLTDVKLARYLKTMPWDFFDFDICIWIDGNTTVDFSKIDSLLTHNFVISKHPIRDCIYNEAQAIKEFRKDMPENIDRLVARYREEGMPEGAGMVASHAIIRKNTEEVKGFCTKWWEEIKQNSHRDQMSFNYVLWKNPLEIKYIDFSTVFRTVSVHR